METQEVLQQCKVEGNVVKLPDVQLDRKAYLDVKKSLELIGGKWKGGKVAGFVFNQDPSELLSQIAAGEKRNLKKEYQFFETPDDLADYLVELADIGQRWTIPGFLILEPSAGQGAIIRAIQRQCLRAEVFAFELMDLNRSILSEMENVYLNKEPDFLKYDGVGVANRIIANPPFTKNQDIDHVYKMYEVLAPGGIMVTITSESWTFGSQKKQVAFKEWLEEKDASVLTIPRETFKESGTSVGGRIIIINK